ncbi:hypothetical protein MUK42_32476 [Musa troglodytarum]|uniref:Uncharacterized protein n=1 Tax=Musa troglodytarum TaxID=320322 RepID=A0A9E7LBK8_9LILI|nr:hypothetical protein MUK42_32476 [Musa troglodytarum]
MTIIMFAQSRCLIGFLRTIMKIQNIDNSQHIRHREVV